MSMHLVTGYAGVEHITAADQGAFNAAFFGTGQYVMESGNMCEASITSNNNVRILDGEILMKGRHIRIEPNTYEDVAITTGTAGMNRNDLIVIDYQEDTGTGIENIEMKVIKGTESSGTATDPAYIDGDILGGATHNQMPLYRAVLKGVVLSAIEPLFDTISNYQALAEKYEKEFVESCTNHLNSLDILDTMEEVEANTQENQLAGALAVRELSTTVSETQEEVFENLIPYPFFESSVTRTGISYVVKDDGTIEVTGKSTGSYFVLRNRNVADIDPLILPAGTYSISGCPQGGASNMYLIQVSKTGNNGANEVIGWDIGKGTTFTLTEKTQIQVGIVISASCPEITTPIVFKAMLVKGSTIPIEYKPYSQGKVTREMLNDKLCENLIPYPYYSTTHTKNGLQYTDGGSGTVDIDGTATAQTSFIFNHRIDNDLILPAGTYSISGCPQGGSNKTYRLVVARTSKSTGSFESIATDYGDGATFTLTEETDLYIGFEVLSGVTITKMSVSPMLVKGNIIPKEYKPYSQAKVTKKQISDLSFKKMSKADYDALETKDANTVYFTYE